MAIEFLTVKNDLTTLDLLIWRRFKRDVPGLVEQTMDLNQNLADGPVYLPIWTVVKVPVPKAATAKATVRVVSLFD